MTKWTDEEWHRVADIEAENSRMKLIKEADKGVKEMTKDFVLMSKKEFFGARDNGDGTVSFSFEEPVKREGISGTGFGAHTISSVFTIQQRRRENERWFIVIRDGKFGIVEGEIMEGDVILESVAIEPTSEAVYTAMTNWSKSFENMKKGL